MIWYASIEKMEEQDGFIYNTVKNKRVMIGLNCAEGDYISLDEFLRNPSKTILILDLPDDKVNLYKMTTLNEHKTHAKDIFYSEMITPFIERKYVTKQIELSDEQYLLLLNKSINTRYIMNNYYIFDRIDNYLEKHCIDWFTCVNSECANLYDFLTCIDEIPSVTELDKKIKIDLRKRVGKLLILIEDSEEDIEDSSNINDNNDEDEEDEENDTLGSIIDTLDDIQDVGRIINDYIDVIRDEESKRLLTLC